MAVRRAGDWDGAAVTLPAPLFDAPGPFPPSPWRRRRGALWDIGPDAVAMVLATLGPVGEITAAAGRGDTVHLVLRHASGSVEHGVAEPDGPGGRGDELLVGHGLRRR
jgi:predicted dehydrogenase